ncbi:MAG TPA: non-canonical purine NTP pyrophosphatase [Chloroflexota bacterium]
MLSRSEASPGRPFAAAQGDNFSLRERSPELLLATSNAGKLRDLRLCLAECGWDLCSPIDVGLSLGVAETGATYAENARLKAAAYFQASGLPTLGEDSGLEIDTLEGAPGIFSARFEGLPDGPIKNARILELLAGLPASKRRCHYHCALVLVQPDRAERLFEGTCIGRIAFEPAGEGGFGFDPIVLLPRLSRTLAQLDNPERLRVNHRGRAARKLATYLRSFG